MMKELTVPPYAPILMEAIRAIGYSLEAAIADIIDNSIAAGASIAEILFFPIGDSYIAILDNGNGMDEKGLIEAMRYGSKNPADSRDSSDLGRFGLGLKTASLSQCKKMTVISKKDNLLVGAQWNLDHIDTTREWTLIILSYDEIKEYPGVDRLSKYSSGTLVIWQQLDRLMSGESNFEAVLGQKMDIVREHLSLVFHRYLSGEAGIRKLTISMNGLSVAPADPFLISKSTRIMDDEIIVAEGQKVVVRPYILPHLSNLTAQEIKMLGGKDGLRQKQGFYVYRNKRLLVGGTWFRLMQRGELSKLARVQVDIPNSLDHLWTLDIKKSTAVPPDVVRKNLGIIIDKIAEGSRRTWTYRGKNETDDSKIRLWNRYVTREDGITYSINRDHPLITRIDPLSTSQKQVFEQILRQLEQGLPLQQLYVDLTSDKQVDNEKDISKDDFMSIIRQILSNCSGKQECKEMLERMTAVEPFDQHPEWIEEIGREVLNDG